MRSKLGIATLEALAISTIGLPIIISAFSIFEIINIKLSLDNLARTHIENIVVKPYRLFTGDQLWVQAPIDYADSGEISRSDPSLKSAITEHHRRLNELVDYSEENLRKLLGHACLTDCRKRYKVELRHALVATFLKNGKPKELECTKNNRRCTNGLYEDLNEGSQKQHAFLRIRGQLNQNSVYFREELRKIVLDPSTANYTLATGLFSVESQQIYGNQDFLEDVNPNFIRRMSIYGLNLEIDLGNSLAGKFLKYFRALKNLPGGSVLKSYSMSVPKKEI